ncbi:MAG: hypothetical protein XD87_0444 [candidate division WS6 bacterium 36_33]|uniref:Transmembrane(S)protein n=1 Tax=candidate division WS6 bacterium 36_33 TaxID=1641388 RepID=A0A101GYA7_9BACT|nr:MAG: hypothetical protein XD87_0444 [candidate division WS6 bacterium 36_33]
MVPLKILEYVLLFFLLTANITKLILKEGLRKLVLHVAVVVTLLFLTILYVVTDQSFWAGVLGILTGVNFVTLAIRIFEKEN